MDTWSESGDDKDMNAAPVQLYPHNLNPPSNPTKKSTANRSLIQKIESIISSYELQEKYSTKLTLHSLDVIEQLIKKKPEFFRMVESTLVRNVSNNEILAKDIPYIISIISQLYMLLNNMHFDNIDYENISDTCNYILKFVFSVVIRENLVEVNNETGAILLLLCCDNIIDSCIKLLKIKGANSRQPPVRYMFDKIPEPTVPSLPLSVPLPVSAPMPMPLPVPLPVPLPLPLSEHTTPSPIMHDQKDRCC